MIMATVEGRWALPRLATALLVFCGVASWTTTVEGGDPFATCESRFASRPDRRESAACFYAVAREKGLWEEAARRTETRLRAHPDLPWLHVYLGNCLWPTGSARPESLYRTAARLFAARGDHSGEVLARVNRAIFLSRSGRLTEAGLELHVAETVAEAGGQPLDAATVQMELAAHLRMTGGDLGEAYHRLRDAEAALFPDGPASLRRNCLASLWNVTYDLGRYREARDYARRRLELARAEGDSYGEASALYSLAITATELESPGASSRRKLLEQLRNTLRVARLSGHRSVEARTLLLIAKLERGDAARQHLERCLALAAELPAPGLQRDCLRFLARTLVAGAPTRAERLFARAAELEAASEDPWALLYGWPDEMDLYWRLRPQKEALAASEAILDAIESMRRAQSGLARARLLSVWSDAHYWLSGRLLEAARDVPETANREALQERAFDVMERLRAQVLREAIGAGGRAATMPPSATLAALRSNLADDQALLLFQVFLWRNYYDQPAGGSWLLSVTRGGVRSYRLPDRAELEPAVHVLLGMGDPEAVPAALPSLYGSLLEQAISDLPVGVTRLVVVPDGALHLLPFAALRRDEQAPPLVSEFELSFAPSATLWLHWERAEAATGPTPALVLAAPRLPTRPFAAIAEERGWAPAPGMVLGALPHARREGRAVERRLGNGTRVLSGAAASEAALKAADLSSIRLLHFATHAVVDEEQPERSALLLAAGAEGEDGYLQPAEIARLDLDGRVVVLSACRSAAGGWLRGEGVMSLARAFFQAGAHAVVGTLWPVRDDRAADFFDEFYRQLRPGRSLGSALAAAQRRQIALGGPAAGWASFVLFGDGELAPVPRPAAGTGRTTTARAVVTSVALTLTAILGLLAVRKLILWTGPR